MKIAYNHEMLICFTSQTPYQSYETEVGKEQFRGYVRELAGTGVDILMCCPTAWRLPLYYSEVNRVWQTWGRTHRDPNAVSDWKYFDKVFHRVREYMLSPDYEDPVEITLAEARKHGISPFISWRMNDLHQTHYNETRVPPVMDDLWIDHPEMRLSAGNMNYMISEVRQWYFDILQELVSRYDIDGLELDFMRYPLYFEPAETEKGIPVMTEFVRRIRKMTDAKGIKLAVRVPASPKKAVGAGLDVADWKAQGLIDLITVSTYYKISPEQNIEEYRDLPGKAEVFGELHFITFSGVGTEVARFTTREIYETLGASLLERGADGLSFFNFAYVRDHHFSEARQRRYMDREPDFSIFADLKNAGHLKKMPLHAVMTPGENLQPSNYKPVDFQLYLPESVSAGRSAMFRLEFSRPGVIYHSIRVRINGSEPVQVPGSGELFRPFSNKALPAPDCLFFFEVPVSLLHHGWNDVHVEVKHNAEFSIPNGGGKYIVGAELAVYP